MIDRGYYLLERKRGVRAVWLVDYNRKVDTTSGKVSVDSVEHKIPRGLFTTQVITSFDKILKSLSKFGGDFDEDTAYFLMRRAYAPRKYNLDNPNTNDILVVGKAKVEYSIMSIEVADVLVVKLKKVST